MPLTPDLTYYEMTAGTDIDIPLAIGRRYVYVIEGLSAGTVTFQCQAYPGSSDYVNYATSVTADTIEEITIGPGFRVNPVGTTAGATIYFFPVSYYSK